MAEVLYIPAKFHWNSLINNRTYRTDLPRMCTHDLDLLPTSLIFESSRPLVKYYQPAQFEKDRVVNNREIADCSVYSSVTLWLWPFTFTLINVYCCFKSYNNYLSTGQIWERSDEKSHNADSGKEIKEKKRKKRQHNNREVFRLRLRCTKTCIWYRISIVFFLSISSFVYVRCHVVTHL